jgi:hypothetical protein
MKMNLKTMRVVAALLAMSLVANVAIAQEADKAELAKQLSNPIASLINVPFQLNYDSNLGLADDGDQFKLNIQPVIPISLNEKWNLISRTIIPVLYVQDTFPGQGSEFGLGDITPAFWFSPKAPTKGGLIWGVGPQFLLPTATEDVLGAEKWGAGPTAIALKQSGGWTYGALVGHIWSFAGTDNRSDISLTNFQPFLARTWPSSITLSANLESTYNWEADDDEWSIPVNVQLSKVVKAGNQLWSIKGGIRYWAENPDTGAEDWGFRFEVAMLFPR